MPFPHNCYSGGSLENTYWANKEAYLAKRKEEAKQEAEQPHSIDAFRSVENTVAPKEAATHEDLARLMTAGNGTRKTIQSKKSNGISSTGTHYSKP